MANSLRLAATIALAILALNLKLATSSRALGTCHASGYILRETSSDYRTKNISNCCEARKMYPRYHCSPQVKRNTPAIMTFNSFTMHGRLGGPSAHNRKYHHHSTSDNESYSRGMSPYGRRYDNVAGIKSNGGVMSLDGSKYDSLDTTKRYSSMDTTKLGISVVENRGSGMDSASRYYSIDTTKQGIFVDGNSLGIPDSADRYRNIATTKQGISVDGNRFGSLDSANKYLQRSPSKCDEKYHSNEELVVALSTGWYDGGSRCLKNIRIEGHGKSVVAKVVDECDSVDGCDSQHHFRMPCGNNIVDASPAVWKALGIPKKKIGSFEITWSDV